MGERLGEERELFQGPFRARAIEELPKVLSVSQLTHLIKELLETSFGGVWVEGEISNVSTPFSGHTYFVLKDEGAQIRCVIFRQQARLLAFLPENGMKVLVRGELTVYSPKGEYQLLVDHMEPLGIGALALAFEQLKNKLNSLGVFDETKKKPLPYLPKKVAVITSPTGAAIRDFLKVVQRRFADLHIIVVPVRVQGEEATKDIVEALSLVNRYLQVDVIVITRGGGSLEDLWPFNQEALAYAIRESKIPVVSAVGHEIDWTICDMASDFRAPTPSAAAEILVKEKYQLELRLTDFRARIYNSFKNQLVLKAKTLSSLKERFKVQRRQISVYCQMLDDITFRLQQAILSIFRSKRENIKRVKTAIEIMHPLKLTRQYGLKLSQLRSQLINSERYHLGILKTKLFSKRDQIVSLNPLKILERGYSITITVNTKQIIKSADQLKPNTEIETVYWKGKSISIVTQTSD